jgi:tetratricopeptide (TPR) repeat protein
MTEDTMKLPWILLVARKMSSLAILTALMSSVTAPQTARDVARKAFPSVVMIIARQPKGKTVSLGSGFVVRPGVVATNYHVIKGAASLHVKPIGQHQSYTDAKVLSVDSKRDLALLTVDELDAPPLALADSSDLEVGDEVYAIGNPEGLEATLSQGIVSGIRYIEGQQYIQITAAISHGSSGGPVVKADGDVVGIAVGSVQSGQDLNFAIPVTYLTKLIAGTGRADPGASSSLGSPLDGEPILGRKPPIPLSSTKPYLDQAAKAELNRARNGVHQNPSSPGAHLELAEVYRRVGMFSESLKEYREALRLKPDYFQAYMDQGDCYADAASFLFSDQDRKYYKAAAESYRRALAIRPNSPEAVLHLGEVYNSMLRQDDALRMFELAISIKPNYGEAYYGIGEAYRLIGVHQRINANQLPTDEWRKSYALAIEAYKRAAGVGPSNTDAWCAMGDAYRELGQDDQAISGFTGAVANGDPFCTDELIKLYKARGRMREALSAAEKLASTSPSNGAAHFLLGCVYLEVGDEKQAVDEYTLLKQQRPDLPEEQRIQWALLASRLFDRIYR